MGKPLFAKKCLLEKFPGKGGWTYAAIPGIIPDKKAPFGWRRVKGKIDDFEFKNYHLMPMGNGQLFLPVKAEIRKKIGKKEGDWINVILYLDNSPIEIPYELLICLKEDTRAYESFMKRNDGEKKAIIDWIYSAKHEETKVSRIAKTLNLLTKADISKPQ
jgi:hypothetical protein